MALDLSVKTCSILPVAFSMVGPCSTPRGFQPHPRARACPRAIKKVRFDVDSVPSFKTTKTETQDQSMTRNKRKHSCSDHPSDVQEKRLRFLESIVHSKTDTPLQTEVQTKSVPQPALPEDPREWTRENVFHWLQFMQTTHQLENIPRDRFMMNGKALCLMSAAMFSMRVPLGGKLLYKDFRMRLTRAMAGLS